MGTRSQTDTLSGIWLAFQQQPTWSQAELARKLGIGVPALRKKLLELKAKDPSIKRDEDPPNVFWSVSKGWSPTGVTFDADQARDLVRLLSRLPTTPTRDKLLRRILSASPSDAQGSPGDKVVVTSPASESEMSYLSIAEDAARRQVTLRFRYYTSSRGAVEERAASVQRVIIGEHTRFVAVCHRNDQLKWFRLDNVMAAQLAPEVPFRHAEAARVEAMLQESLDGFHQGDAPIECAFFVTLPEANWVERNLPGSASKMPTGGGVRFSIKTSGVLRLARFVVGLGRAARVETPELGAMVEELAKGALGTSCVRGGKQD